MFKSARKVQNPQPAKTLASLPPDLIIRIFQYLPIPDLPQVACTSRRFKVLVAADDVYEHKLRALNMIDALAIEVTGSEGKDALSARLRKLPGGHLLPGNSRYLEQGSHWGLSEPQASSTAIEDGNKEGSIKEIQENLAQADIADIVVPDPILKSTQEQKTTEAVPQQQISSILPNPKITIGAGGLRAANQAKKNNDAIGKKRVASATPVRLSGRTSRDVFKQVYRELYPYFVDFRVGQKDSKVFKDYKDVVEIAAILHRLRLFSLAKFIPLCDDIHFALETTIEWFESTILGNFEEAYDKHDIMQMRQNALASFQLNGGAGAVNVFIAKNPIFFDHSFNPSLVASRLPSAGGPAVGYALADEFAKYMDHMLNNCKKQAELVAQVFVPEVDALTLFVNKVFEDSIAEYLSAVLKASKAREGLGIYLHTLATSVYCCTQFLDYIANNPYKVKVDSLKLKDAIAIIFRPYTDDYMNKELEHMKKRIDAELEKWNTRV